MRGRRGLTLAGVLMVALLAMTAAFAMAAIVSSHLNYAEHYAFGQEALYLAEAGVTDVVNQIHQNAAYGTNNEVLHLTPAEPDRDYVVTFVPGAPLYSTNNFDSQHPDGCDGPGTVAATTAHIVCVGTAHGQTRVVDVVVGVPAFPYVVGIGGVLQANSLVVRGAATMAEFVAQEQGLAPIKPAEAAANVGVKVTQSCNISGDLLTPDVIELPPNAVIGGTIRNGTTELPDITITQFDPSADPTAVHLSVGAASNLNGLAGKIWADPASGTLQVSGDLNLNGALFYVKGNLVVQGGITGQGAVVVEGTTSMGGASLSAGNTVAVVGGKMVSITGSGAQSYFQGLVYTRQDFQASNVTVAGTFVTGGGSDPAHPPAQGGMQLNGATLVGVQQTASLQVSTTMPLSDLALTVTLAMQPGSEQTFATLTINPDQAPIVLKPAREQAIAVAEQPLQGQPYHFIPAPQGPNAVDLSTVDLPLGGGNVLRVLIMRGGGTPSIFPTEYNVSNGTQTALQPAAATALAASVGVDYLNGLIPTVVGAQNAAWNTLYQYCPPTSTAGSMYNLDLNKFLRDTMPIQVLSWRQR